MNAHVIQHVEIEGYYAIKRLHSVVLGSKQDAQRQADALNSASGYTDYDPEDGMWFGPHYHVTTIPVSEG